MADTERQSTTDERLAHAVRTLQADVDELQDARDELSRKLSALRRAHKALRVRVAEMEGSPP